MRYLLDTNIWIWWNNTPDLLSQPVYRQIAEPKADDEFLLSAISPWEVFKLVEKGRLALNVDALEWVESALQMARLRLVDLTPRIAHQSTTLPGTLHGDPADQIVVATARIERAVILTKDRKILDYPHVRSLW